MQFLVGELEEPQMAKTLSPIHHARWMSSAIYILKMFICQDVFKPGSQYENDIYYMSWFLVYVYFLYWFRCTNLADAPILTLDLHHDLESWNAIDKEGSQAAIRKMDLHTDYLNGRSVVLTFASNLVNSETKELMARKLLEITPVNIQCGKPQAPRVYQESSLEDYIDEESWLFFKLSNVDPTFLNLPCSEWSSNANYISFLEVVDGMSPLNDAGERAVKFSADFHGRLSQDKGQHQAVLQSVSEHRRSIPSGRKEHYKDIKSSD